MATNHSGTPDQGGSSSTNHVVPRDDPQPIPPGRKSKYPNSRFAAASSIRQELRTEPTPSGNAEDSVSTQKQPNLRMPYSLAFVKKKVKDLLENLNPETFDSISEQVLKWANRSVNEVDVLVMIQVVHLVVEHAISDSASSETCARMCRFLMEHVSQDVRNEKMKDESGELIVGGDLFRKYLIIRCQRVFDQIWDDLDIAVAVARTMKDDNHASEKLDTSSDHSPLQMTTHRACGLVIFLMELFKQKIISERIMHECIRKLLNNIEDPLEEGIEILCVLLAAVGETLDTPKARNHINNYFARMLQLANSDRISSRIHFMLFDVIELRKKKWVFEPQPGAESSH